MLPPIATATILAALPVPPGAQDGAAAAVFAISDSGDTAWLLAASALMMMMILPGLALFIAGRIRADSALSSVAQLGAVVASVSILWVVVGYTLAFGGVTNGWLGGGVFWMLGNLGAVRAGLTVPESVFALFQMMFAAFAAALLVGACVERARFGWVVTVAALWSLLVYAPVAHWVWGGGWLASGWGTMDFGGGIVVHLAAGVSALVLALLLGRRERGEDAAPARSMPALTLAGAALLWVGWFGFTGGGALGATDDAAATLINTQLAASAGALGWALLERLSATRLSAHGWALGAIAGLIAITPAAGYLAPALAILTGAVGAIACKAALGMVAGRWRIDEPLGIFALNGVGGAVGSLLMAVTIGPALRGIGYPEGMTMARQLLAQAVGVGAVALYAAFATAILALAVGLFLPMRVDAAEERAGLDSALRRD